MYCGNKKERHANLCAELNMLYSKKNDDYGDSFHDTFLEEGLAASRIRLSDKLNRFKQLSKAKNAEGKVKDESIRDTLIDLANYALMTILEIDGIENTNEVIESDESSDANETKNIDEISYKNYHEKVDHNPYYGYTIPSFDNRDHAEKILDMLRKNLELYGVAYVADLFDYIGGSYNYLDDKYGWTDLKTAKVCWDTDNKKYIIKLPEVELL